MPIGGTCTERTIQATDVSDHRFWRKSSELCFRLGGEILRVLYDVINDVANEVIFHLKKLILKPFLHILKEASTKVLVRTFMKKHRLGFPKIGQNSRIDLRGLSYARAKLLIFVIFNRIRGNALRTNHKRWRSTRPQMCLSGQELCIRVDEKKSECSRAAEITS